VIGRFYSDDPVAFTGSEDTFNRYSYVANNPYKYVDPTGEVKISIGYEAQLVAIAGFKISTSVSYDTDNGEISGSIQGGPRLGLGAALGPTVNISQSEGKPATTEDKAVDIAITTDIAAGPLGGSTDLLTKSTLAGDEKTSVGTAADDSGGKSGKISFKPGVSLTVGIEVTKEITSDDFAKDK